MAIARVQGPLGIAAASPTTKSFLNDPTVGNLMIATGRSYDGGSFTNGSIPGWTRAIGTQTGSTAWLALWYKVVTVGESKDVVLTWTGSTGTLLVIEEWGGFTGTPTLDKTKNVDTTGSAVTSRSSGTTDTTTANDELCFAVFGHGNPITAPSWTNSFDLEVYDNPASIKYVLLKKVVSSTGAYETTLSWTTARVSGGLIATFMGIVSITWIPKVIIIS